MSLAKPAAVNWSNVTGKRQGSLTGHALSCGSQEWFDNEDRVNLLDFAVMDGNRWARNRWGLTGKS